jgi:ADP-ribosyl-[dinitrogen reductase] hydrolase
MNQSNDALFDRYLGCFFGMAVGDALGAPVEFQQPGNFEPITDMRAGGPFNLPAGCWTDDTSMALCIAASLVENKDFIPLDIIQRFVRWYREGYLSSTGECFDIGNRTRAALEDFERTNQPFRSAGFCDFPSNGSIMRLAPIPMAYRADPARAIHLASESSRLTHNHPDAQDACRYLAALIIGALNGASKADLLQPFFDPAGHTWHDAPLTDAMAELASGAYRDKPQADIHPSAHAVRCLEAALWAFMRTDSFEGGLLLVVNMGDDSDTTGAVYGQLAGAYYGYDAIPQRWLKDLTQPALLREYTFSLLQLSRNL